MNPFVETCLSLILFLPTFCILGGLYCLFPQGSRSLTRGIADLAVLALAAGLSIGAMRWGFRAATGSGSPIWKQVFAALVSYAVFLCVIGCAFFARSKWLTASHAHSRRVKVNR